MIRDVDGFQISEATPQSDGSLVTLLYDPAGNQVGTVRRSSDGTTTAENVAGGFHISGLLERVTNFLDEVARSGQQTSDELTRISRGIKGAATGAQAGYSAPIDWKPYAVAGVALLVAVAIASSSRGSRKR